jgi:hypothetical protein
VIHVFKRRMGLFLTLCQFAGYSSFALLHRTIHADTARRIPLKYYIVLASLQVKLSPGGNWFQPEMSINVKHPTTRPLSKRFV